MYPVLHPVPLAIFMVLSIPISLIDLRTLRIPDILNYSCFLLILTLQMILRSEGFPNYLLTSLFCVLGFLGIRGLTRGLGLGDVKYAAAIGMLCGFPLVLTALLFASITGLIAAGIQFLFSINKNINRRKMIRTNPLTSPIAKNTADWHGFRKQQIPFAPFLSLGVWAAAFFFKIF